MWQFASGNKHWPQHHEWMRQITQDTIKIIVTAVTTLIVSAVVIYCCCYSSMFSSCWFLADLWFNGAHCKCSWLLFSSRLSQVSQGTHRPEGITEILSNLKSSKCCGHDNLSSEFVKQLSMLYDFLLLISSTILSAMGNLFPSDLKIAKLFPYSNQVTRKCW